MQRDGTSPLEGLVLLGETIEIRVRNHKEEAVEVLVRETLFRWATNDVVEASQRYERQDARTVEFPVQIARDGEAVVRYRVRYRVRYNW